MPNLKTKTGARNGDLKRAEKAHEQLDMLRKMQTLQERIALCRRLASECAQKAEAAANQQSRDDYVRTEKSWINLAHSYEFAAQILNKRNSPARDGSRTGVMAASRLH